MPITTVEVELVGHDGNAHTILSRVIRAMRAAEVVPEVIAAYLADAIAGDHDHLLQVATRYVRLG